jgi:hypothetical protein
MMKITSPLYRLQGLMREISPSTAISVEPPKYEKIVNLVIHHDISPKSKFRVDMWVDESVYRYKHILRESMKYPNYLFEDAVLDSGLCYILAHNLEGPAFIVTENGKVTKQEYHVKGKLVKLKEFEQKKHDAQFSATLDDILED